MPRRRGNKAPSGAGGAGGASGTGGAPDNATAVKDDAELLRETQQELRLWQTYPDACKLIQTQSAVFRAAEEGAEAGKVFVYPIVAAFGQAIGAAEPSQEQIAGRMRLVELLAVVDAAAEPDALCVFRMTTEQLALCRDLLGRCTKAGVLPLLERMHDIAEYLQLDKRLCARLRQLMAAERFFCGEYFIDDIKGDSEVGPLLKEAIDGLAATPIPATLATIALYDQPTRELLDLPSLLWEDAVLSGALGWTAKEFGGNLEWSAAVQTTTQLFFVFGQALARRTLSPGLLEALAATEMRTAVLRCATRVVEALVVLGRGQAALKMVQEGGIPMPRHLCRSGDALVVVGA